MFANNDCDTVDVLNSLGISVEERPILDPNTSGGQVKLLVSMGDVLL